MDRFLELGLKLHGVLTDRVECGEVSMARFLELGLKFDF